MATGIGKEILDLLGRKFRVGKWDICPLPLLGIPEDYAPCLTRDRLSDTQMILFISPDQSHYIMQTHNRDGFYVRYQVEFLEYIPSQDMRNIRV